MRRHGAATGKPAAAAVELLAASCEDGTAPTRSAGGAYSCEDGSAPACESGRPVSAATGQPLCAVKPGEKEEEVEFVCEEASQPTASSGCEIGTEEEALEPEEEE